MLDHTVFAITLTVAQLVAFIDVMSILQVEVPQTTKVTFAC